MNMKFKATLLGLSIAAVLPTMNMAQTPVYLDTSKPIEERVKDALSRMTLEEKVMRSLNLVHRESLVWGFPKYGQPMVLTASVPKYYGMSGIRQDGQTIPV